MKQSGVKWSMTLDLFGSDLHNLLYLLIIVAPWSKFSLAGIVHLNDEPAAEMFVDLFDSAQIDQKWSVDTQKLVP